MSDIAIRCEGLSKQYRIGEHDSYKTLRDVIADSVASPFRRLRSALARNGASSNGSHSSLSTQHSVLGSADSALASGTRNSFWALDDVSFEVKRGEALGIIGRNGAGKSTLLKILSRITQPTRGHAQINGRVASLLEVGTGFHPELTGRENIFLNGAILGMKRDEISRKFDQIVAFAELDQFIDTAVKRYSSGMYVRLAFAVAAHLEPDILVVDEVLAVGDIQFQKKCLGKMGEVASVGRTVVFISHNMAAVTRLCTKAMLLSNGRLVETGEPHAVIGAYLKDSLRTEAVVELPDAVHRVKSPLQIRSVEVLNSAGQPSAIMFAEEDIQIRLTIQAQESMKQSRIGIGVYAEGVRVTTLHTSRLDVPSSSQSQLLTCIIPGGSLLPNFYSLHVGAHSAETGKGLDWVADAVSFQIEPVKADGSGEHDQRVSGLVAIKVSWEGSLIESNEMAQEISPVGY
ncbi:MAG TPA: ABC transporter ATP-binding protein [Pyrinomonadaceae bacterium]|nr:ABC transporter ATP-binding protein [Pyrinomonadaceae bacterium]